MNVGTILMILFAICILISDKSKKVVGWRLFVFTIFISTFINVCTAGKLGVVSITYSMVLQMIFIVWSIAVKNFKLYWKDMGALALFGTSIIISYVLLILGKDTELVVPFDTSIDNVYSGKSIAIVPHFGAQQESAMIVLFIFIVFLLMAKEYLIDKEWRDKSVNISIRIFRIYFIAIFVEFVINNFINEELVRKIVTFILGIPQDSVAYPQIRGGIYSVLTFFSEPSYAVVGIVYYLIMFTKQERTKKDIIWNIVGMMALLSTSSGSAIVIIPFALVSTIWNGRFSLKKIKIRKQHLILWGGMVLLAICFMCFEYNAIYELLKSINDKIVAYIVGTEAEKLSASGAIRKYGNELIYNVFFSQPLFGYGIGSARGYGVLPGMLGTMGIVGIYTYWRLMKSVFRIRLNEQSIFLLVVSCLYATSVLSIWYIYEPMIILVFYAIKQCEQFELIKEGI